MPSNQTCTLIIAISLVFGGCRSDASKQGPEADSTISDLVIPNPGNIPEDVFLSWQMAMDKSKFKEARQWSSPATQEWINVLEELVSQADSPPIQAETSIESIQCQVFGDTAICFFAEVRDQMLQMDSVRMVRLMGEWKVDLQGDTLKQNGVSEK